MFSLRISHREDALKGATASVYLCGQGSTERGCPSVQKPMAPTAILPRFTAVAQPRNANQIDRLGLGS